jgi:hypothetical protein
MKKRKFRSEAMEALFDNVLSNYKIGAISEERFHQYEEACCFPEKPKAHPVSASGKPAAVPLYAGKR